MSRITHPTNAASAVVGSEAAPAKLMTTAPRLFACHVVTAFVFLDALSALGTLFDAPPVIEGLQQRSLFVVFRISIILRAGVAGAALVPLTTGRETGLALALVARESLTCSLAQGM